MFGSKSKIDSDSDFIVSIYSVNSVFLVSISAVTWASSSAEKISLRPPFLRLEVIDIDSFFVFSLIVC